MRPPEERDVLEMIGVVRDMRRGSYVVEAVAGALRREVLCKLSGRLQVNRIRVIPGDEVTVEVSAFDLTRGRIVFRGQRERER